jgi:hypothetical protein
MCRSIASVVILIALSAAGREPTGLTLLTAGTEAAGFDGPTPIRPGRRLSKVGTLCNFG